VPRRLFIAGVVVIALLGLGLLLAAGVEKVRDAAERSKCNLTQVALALNNYQAHHGGLPPATVYGKGGEPLYSWRVLILPYIDQEELYGEFRLDEPWDSPHNLGLLPRMPGLYAPPGRKASMVPPHHTTLQVFVGREAAFEERPQVRRETADAGKPQVGLKVPDDFPDGQHNTFLFVEAGEPVPWTKPGELAYDPKGPLPELRCLFRDGFRACMADCSRRFVPKGTPEATMRALITRDGGDHPGEDW
jgi:hypothetical protein